MIDHRATHRLTDLKVVLVTEHGPFVFQHWRFFALEEDDFGGVNYRIRRNQIPVGSVVVVKQRRSDNLQRSNAIDTVEARDSLVAVGLCERKAVRDPQWLIQKVAKTG